MQDDSTALLDVITCAAPNWKAARQNGRSPASNVKALTSRISFIRDIAEECHVDTIILGAFGCGVFGQDPSIVASIFNKVFISTTIRQIIYAVPGAKTNSTIFQLAVSKANESV